MALNEIHAILKRTRYGTGSQWGDLSSGADFYCMISILTLFIVIAAA